MAPWSAIKASNRKLDLPFHRLGERSDSLAGRLFRGTGPILGGTGPLRAFVDDVAGLLLPIFNHVFGSFVFAPQFSPDLLPGLRSEQQGSQRTRAQTDKKESDS